jgi:PAS domain S-box-containing protein
MRQIEDTQATLIRSVERTALVARYVALFIMIPLFFLGFIVGSLGDLVIIVSAVVAHNIFAHWVLSTGRHGIFRHPVNFMIYFVEICVVVFFSGADQSVGFVLYLIFLVGFSAYSRRFTTIILTAALLCLSYLGILFIEWHQEGISESMGGLVFKQISIFVTGWLVAVMSENLRRVEVDSFERAQELAASEATLRTILNNAADPILVFDENEFVVEANESLCEAFGFPRDEVIGQRIRSFLFDDGTLSTKLAGLRTFGEYRSEMLTFDIEGQERTIDVVVRSFIRDHERYFVAVSRDVTFQKELQEATRQANVKLERLNRELRQVDQLKTGFLATISQKLRSPLSAVLGYLDMLLEEELGDTTPGQRRALQTCRRGTLRAFRVIDEALDFKEAGPTENGAVTSTAAKESGRDES